MAGSIHNQILALQVHQMGLAISSVKSSLLLLLAFCRLEPVLLPTHVDWCSLYKVVSLISLPCPPGLLHGFLHILGMEQAFKKCLLTQLMNALSMKGQLVFTFLIYNLKEGVDSIKNNYYECLMHVYICKDIHTGSTVS